MRNSGRRLMQPPSPTWGQGQIDPTGGSRGSKLGGRPACTKYVGEAPQRPVDPVDPGRTPVPCASKAPLSCTSNCGFAPLLLYSKIRDKAPTHLPVNRQCVCKALPRSKLYAEKGSDVTN